MPITDYTQITALADSTNWQQRVRSATLKQSAYILDNQGSFTAAQISLAKNILKGASVTSYFSALAGGSAAVASTISYDFQSRQVVTDMTDAALTSAVMAEVFGNLL